MPCYGRETGPIEELAARLSDVDPEVLFNLSPNAAASFAEEYFGTNREIADSFLYAFICFLRVMQAVMERKLELLGIPEDQNGDHRFQYLRKFLPIYERATRRSEKLLLEWMRVLLKQNPEACAQFVREIVASETVAEMHAFTSGIENADSLDDVNAHGASGYEVENSIKDFIRDKLGSGMKDGIIRRCFQALNEVIGIIFPGAK